MGYGRLNAYRALQAALNASGDSDGTPPSAAVSAPLAGSTLAGTVMVNLSGADNVGVTQLDLLLDGAVAASFIAFPASFAWDTTLTANGSHTIQARAHDAAGNTGNSAMVSVSVQNTVPDTGAPTAQVTSPTSGASVAGTVSVSVSANDNIGVTCSGSLCGRNIGRTAHQPLRPRSRGIPRHSLTVSTPSRPALPTPRGMSASPPVSR
jgi:hypothetical protein